MCGRFVLKTLPNLLDDVFGPFGRVADIPQLPLFNIAPTQTVPIVRNTDDGRELIGVRWGLVPSWSKELAGPLLINARSETAATKPAFRSAMKSRRCLIPADGFYEWQKQGEGTKAPKVPHYIHRKDDKPFAFAGLWERWMDDADHVLCSCTILTTTPNAVAAPIHDRMPVILDPADYDSWLDPATPADEVAEMLRPASAKPMEVYPVSTLVNSARNQGAGLIEPAA